MIFSGRQQAMTDARPQPENLIVLSERKNGPVMMIGDAVNDGPGCPQPISVWQWLRTG